jgi:hypothetical protein
MNPLFLQQSQLLAAINAYLALLPSASQIGLVKGTVPTGDKTVLSSLTQPSGSWYALKAAVLIPTYEDQSDNLYFGVLPVQFRYSGSSASEIITGAILLDTTGAILLGVCPLTNPVTMSDTLDVTVTPQMYCRFGPVGP